MDAVFVPTSGRHKFENEIALHAHIARTAALKPKNKVALRSLIPNPSDSFPKAINEGVRAVRGSHVVVLSALVAVESSSFKQVLEYSSKEKEKEYGMNIKCFLFMISLVDSPL